MKVIHIESGLGNQMLSYCEYLSLKKMNPNDDFYIENIIFDIPECNEVTCQWNGYELKKIFGIDHPANIRTLFTQGQWDSIMKEIKDSEFWNKNMNYPIYFTQAFNNAGLSLVNEKGNYEDACFREPIIDTPLKKVFKTFKETNLAYILRRIIRRVREKKYIKENDRRSKLFVSTSKDLFTGQWLAFKFRGNNRELIDNEIRQTFKFPKFIDQKNIEMSQFLSKVNSVAIHARRGDMLGTNGWCYKHGYFRRAVNHIRKHVENPVFVFFTNTGSIDWCKENADIFGLDYTKDQVCFVDWNAGEESYRDMQLMGFCKHAIITNSTFGWWGAFFINNPNKITISPLIEIDTTTHC